MLANQQKIKIFAGFLILVLLAYACNPATIVPPGQTDTPVPGITATTETSGTSPTTSATATPNDRTATPTATITATPTQKPSNTSGPVDPGNVRADWEKQTCPATVLSKNNDVNMDITGAVKSFLLKIDILYMLVQNTGLTLSNKGLANIDYGGGHKITLYAPANGSGSMKIVEWNGARQVAIEAGAGHVVESDAIAGCRVQVTALGNVVLTGTGTDYVVVALPKAESGSDNVQVAVFNGSVEATNPSGDSLGTIGNKQMGLFADGRVDGIFDMTDTRKKMLQNLANGQDLFGNELQGINPQSLTGSATILTAWNPGQTNALQNVLDLFQKQNPDAKIETQNVPVDTLQEQYKASLAAGNAPAILIGRGDWGPALFQSQSISDLTTLASGDLLKTIQPEALQSATYQKALIGLPLDLQGVVMYRNTNIAPQAPHSYGDLALISRKASSNDQIGVYSDLGFLFSGAHLYGLGGRLMKANGDPAFNSDKGVQWLNLLQSLQKLGPVAYNTDEDLKTFSSGNTGIIFDGTWNLNQLEEAVGKDNLAVDPWPMYSGGHMAGFLQVENLYLNPNLSEEDRKTAWALMEFLLSNRSQFLLERAGIIPAVIGIKPTDSLHGRVMEALQGDFPLPIRPEMQAYWDPMNRLVATYLNKGGSAQDLLTAAEKEILSGISNIRNP